MDINADIVIEDTNYGHGLDMSTYIGSAMQAIYELPLAVFKYNNQITVIKPCYLKEDSEEYNIWKNSCENSEAAYLKRLECWRVK